MSLKNLFNITRPLVVLDTETTGLSPQTDQIIEIGFQMFYPDDRIIEWRSLINPGRSIQNSHIHHITDDAFTRCAKCDYKETEHPHGVLGTTPACLEYKAWPAFKDIAARLAHGFTDVDFAGKNIRYDLRMMAAEFARANVEWSYANARIIDADRIEQLGDPRTLSDLYRKHSGGKEPVDAHQALADVKMTGDVLVWQFTKYDQLPRDLDALHDLQWPGWIDPDRKFVFDEKGEPCFGRWGKYANKPMRKAGPGYWDFILDPKNDFSSEVRALARDAKMGKFPEKRDAVANR